MKVSVRTQQILLKTKAKLFYDKADSRVPNNILPLK